MYTVHWRPVDKCTPWTEDQLNSKSPSAGEKQDKCSPWLETSWTNVHRQLETSWGNVYRQLETSWTNVYGDMDKSWTYVHRDRETGWTICSPWPGDKLDVHPDLETSWTNVHPDLETSCTKVHREQQLQLTDNNYTAHRRLGLGCAPLCLLHLRNLLEAIIKEDTLNPRINHARRAKGCGSFCSYSIPEFQTF